MRIPPELDRRPKYRGYPVPFVNMYKDGIADFRVINPEQMRKVIHKNLCELCGVHIPAGMTKCFPGGEASLESGHFVEGPSHYRCLRYAWTQCPFLLGKMKEYIQLEHRGPLPQKILDKYEIKVDMDVRTERPARMGILITDKFIVHKHRAEWGLGQSHVFEAVGNRRIEWEDEFVELP